MTSNVLSRGDEMGNGGMFDGDGVGSNTPDEDNYPYN